jgi:hypothetical protein
VVNEAETIKTNLQSSGESYEMEFAKDAPTKPPRERYALLEALPLQFDRRLGSNSLRLIRR